MTQTPESPTPEPTPAPAAAPSAPAAATTPPPGYSAPAASPAASGGGAAGLLGSPVAIALCVVGAVLVVVSIFLNWADVSLGSVSFTAKADTVPVQFLVDNATDSQDPSLLVVLIPAAIAILAGIVVKVRWLAILGGLLAIAVAALYIFQVNDGLDRTPEGIDSVFDFIGIAPWFALVGGIFGLVGGLIPKPKSA